MTIENDKEIMVFMQKNLKKDNLWYNIDIIYS